MVVAVLTPVQVPAALQAAATAQAADVRKLLIGHFSARYEDESLLLEEAKKVFPNTYLASEGMQVTL